MIFVGGGAVEAGAEVLAVAEMLQAPVVSYTGGKGIVSDRHYLAQNGCSPATNCGARPMSCWRSAPA